MALATEGEEGGKRWRGKEREGIPYFRPLPLLFLAVSLSRQEHQGFSNSRPFFLFPLPRSLRLLLPRLPFLLNLAGGMGGGVGPGEGEREREAAAVCKVGGRVAARRRRRKSHQSVGCIFHPNRFRAMITLSADRPTADADCAKKDHRRRRRGWKIGWSKLDICASHRGGEQHLSCLCLLQQNGVISHKYAARSPPFPFSPSTGGPNGGGGRGRGGEGEDESLHLSW